MLGRPTYHTSVLLFSSGLATKLPGASWEGQLTALESAGGVEDKHQQGVDLLEGGPTNAR